MAIFDFLNNGVDSRFWYIYKLKAPLDLQHQHHASLSDQAF